LKHTIEKKYSLKKGVTKMAEGTVLISGTQWLGGKGVPVYSNGGNYSTYYQCVELPQQRLYPKMGWPRVYAAGNGGAQYIPEGSPGLKRYNPGSKYVPVPGDLVIENGNSWNPYGHVSVVDYTDTSKGIIYAVEQNASANGRVTYNYNGSHYTGLSASRSVKCILHAPENTLKNKVSEQNIGCLDSFNIQARDITVGGWHAASNSGKGPHSYIFLMDASTGKELVRKKINRVARPDVARAHPNIPGSGMSGFSTSIPITDRLLGKNIKVMSRYATEAGGNGGVSDYNYSSVKKVPSQIQGGSLDSFNIKAREIIVSGWHATSNSGKGPYSYIFLMDADTGKELVRKKINRVARPDVARVHPNISGSGMSGFSTSIPVTDRLLGKNIKVMSRYATQAGGNGGVSDYYYTSVKKTLSRLNVGRLDGTTVTSTAVCLNGWHLTNYADSSTFRYLILIDQATGKEVRRQTFVSASRPDVGRAYSKQPFASNSGFNVTFNKTGLEGKKVKVIARYARDSAGNDPIDDLLFENIISL
jgi:hypothetical protein